MANTNTKEETTIVDDHKKMLIMTGNLSDFQLDNLKKWPFILFDKELDRVSVKYDFTKTVANEEELSAGLVTYDFEFKKNTKMSREETKKKLDLLTLWTRFLFWKETKVDFQRTGKKWEV